MDYEREIPGIPTDREQQYQPPSAIRYVIKAKQEFPHVSCVHSHVPPKMMFTQVKTYSDMPTSTFFPYFVRVFVKNTCVQVFPQNRKNNPIPKKRKTAASKDYASAISHVVQPRFQWCTISPRHFFLSQNDRYGARAPHVSEVVCGHEAAEARLSPIRKRVRNWCMVCKQTCINQLEHCIQSFRLRLFAFRSS